MMGWNGSWWGVHITWSNEGLSARATASDERRLPSRAQTSPRHLCSVPPPTGQRRSYTTTKLSLDCMQSDSPFVRLGLFALRSIRQRCVLGVTSTANPPLSRQKSVANARSKSRTNRLNPLCVTAQWRVMRRRLNAMRQASRPDVEQAAHFRYACEWTLVATA